MVASKILKVVSIMLSDIGYSFVDAGLNESLNTLREVPL